MATIQPNQPILPPLVVGSLAPLAPAGPLSPAAFAVLPLAAAEADAPPLPAAAPAGNAPGAGAAEGTTGAMQLDQLVLARQLTWPKPDAGLLAASWRTMVKTYGQQMASLEQQSRGQQLPASLFMAGQAAAARDGAVPFAIADGEAWRFAAYGWGGQRLELRLAPGEPDEPPGRRRRGKVALRLELELAVGGRIRIQIEALPEGILLELAAASAQGLQHLRATLPEMAEALRRAGVRIVRCTLRDGLQAASAHHDYPMQAAAATLGLSVFRAMAEVALLLSAPAASPAQM
jgi:hypothetical protein